MRIIEYPYSDRLNTEQIAAENVGNPFLRPVVHGFPKALRDKYKDIAECLSAVDEHYKHLARAIGGKVVNHEWVLTSNTYIRSKVGSHAHPEGLIMFDMPGLWLGAIVDWTPGVSIETKNGFDGIVTYEANFKLKEALKTWKAQEGWSSLPGEITDVSQFTSAKIPKRATIANLDPVLVDIDIL